MHQAVIVIPCYNEAARLRSDVLQTFLAHAGVSLLFVDDGSTDATASVLEGVCKQFNGHARMLHLPVNQGKGEAVRQGMLQALQDGASIVGYYDADLSTPPEEMLRLCDELEESAKEVVLGARVRLLGNEIKRRPLRHYLGRIFATCASMCLGIPVYDTQCGAKVFRRSTALQAALAEPFVSRWAFDVELIGRLLRGNKDVAGLSLADFLEVPLRRWHHKGGSKVRAGDFPRMGIDLLRIRRNLKKRGGCL